MAVSDPLLLCSFCSRSSTTIVCHFIHWTHARKPTDFERPFSSVLKVKSNSDFKIRTCFAPQFQRREEKLTLKLEAINSKQKLVKNKKVDFWNGIFLSILQMSRVISLILSNECTCSLSSDLFCYQHFLSSSGLLLPIELDYFHPHNILAMRIKNWE